MTTLPVFPLIRGSRWAVKATPKWSTIVHKSTSGGRLAIPLWPNNPLWEWEWSYEAVLDDITKLSFASPNPNNNTLYTDLQILEAFFLAVKGSGGLFAYAPPNNVITGQVLPTIDANNNQEIVRTIGAYPTGSGMQIINESIQSLNGATPTIIHTGGTFVLSNPGTLAPYEGYALHWTALPTGTVTANYTYYYQCAFSEDMLDFEQFTYNIWQLQSLKFEQVRVTTG